MSLSKVKKCLDELNGYPHEVMKFSDNTTFITIIKSKVQEYVHLQILSMNKYFPIESDHIGRNKVHNVIFFIIFHHKSSTRLLIAHLLNP